MFEEEEKRNFKKRDNIKHIQDVVKTTNKPRKYYLGILWGMSIKTKERLNQSDGLGIRFRGVITLIEINGINRVEDFIQQFS